MQRKNTGDGGESTLTAWIARELALCEQAFKHGVQAALADALHLCKEMAIAAPRWAIDAAAEIVQQDLEGVVARSSGRTANPAAKYRADMIHFDRWCLVKEVREKQARYREALAAADPTDPMIERGRELIEKVGTTWGDAYERASRMLRGTAAQGSEGAIKASYQLVQRQMKTGSSARFYIPVTPRAAKILDNGSGRYFPLPLAARPKSRDKK